MVVCSVLYRTEVRKEARFVPRFGGTLNGMFGKRSTKTALVAVDVQNGFVNEKTQHCLPKIRELVTSGDFDVVAASRFVNPEYSSFRSRLDWNEMGPDDTDGLTLDKVVAEHADVVLDKTGYAMGSGTLVDELRRRKVADVVVCGLETDACVLAVAMLLFDIGFNVSVDLSACATSAGPEIEAGAEAIIVRSFGEQHVYRG